MFPRTFSRWPLVLAMAALAATACSREPAVALEDWGAVPAWQLTDQSGQPIGSQQLAGRPYVANFLFTSCPTTCPPLARATAKLQERLRAWVPAEGTPPVGVVSISVDPITDTPEVLTTFGRKYGADFRIWRLATGDYEAMERLVVDGFHMSLLRHDLVSKEHRQAGHPALKRPTPLDTAHGVQFLLVDGQGHLRGRFDSDDAGIAKLDAALRQLAREGGA